MVGRRVATDYRRDLHFLSRANYRRVWQRYIGIPVQAIVSSVTAKYDALVTRQDKSR